MTVDTSVEQSQESQSDKEINFRKFQAKYEKQLAEANEAMLQKEKELEELRNKQRDEDDDDDPYVDRKKLKKTLDQFGKNVKTDTQTEIQRAVSKALESERNDNWLKSHPDFYETMKHADKIPELDPELAETILSLPEGMERNKLVYRNIKLLELDKPKKTPPSIQEKIDQNRRSPYYQPSGMANSPYSSHGDFSHEGQKQAYEKMQALKKSLRLT